MILGIILIQGDNESEAISNIDSLSNAKHIVIGDAPEFGTILHINANSRKDFNKALSRFVEIPGITVLTLALRG